MRLTCVFSSVFLLGAGFAAAHGDAQKPVSDAASDVIDLTMETFDAIVKKEQLMLVEFFAPWCGHCKALAPEYEEAATALKAKNIKIAKVDCVDQADLCTQYGVTGYPTLKVFRDGEGNGYEGPRKADGIIAYMTKQSLPAVSDVTAATHDEFKGSDKVVVIAYLASSTDAPAPAFSAAANKHRNEYLFGLSTDEKAMVAAGVTPPAIVLYKKFDDNRVDFPSKDIKATDAEALGAFFVENSIPLMDEISGENYPVYASSGLPLAYLFLDPEMEGKDAQINAIKPLAKKHKGTLNFVWIDAVKHIEHAKMLNLKGDVFPAFVIQDLTEGNKYPLFETPSFATVEEFSQKYVDGKLSPMLKSQPIPEPNDEPVTIVVGDQYEQIVHNDKKDVFVELYAPWCGHCKRLSPIWDELGEYFSDARDQITIAKMDATENDIPPIAPFKIQGFPTLKFKPAGSKEFIDYEGDRSFDSLVAFVNEHTKQTLVTKPKAKVEEAAAEPAKAEEHDHEHVEL